MNLFGGQHGQKQKQINHTINLFGGKHGQKQKQMKHTMNLFGSKHGQKQKQMKHTMNLFSGKHRQKQKQLINLIPSQGEQKSKLGSRAHERAHAQKRNEKSGKVGNHSGSQTKPSSRTLLLEPEISNHHRVLSNQEFYIQLHHLRDLNLNQRSQHPVFRLLPEPPPSS